MIRGLHVGLALPTESGDPLDLVNGLPVHPLVVHAAVVLIPLSALGVIVMAFWSGFSRRHGWLVLGVSAAAAAASVAAKESGEALAQRAGGPGFDHADLGDLMPTFALALLAVTLVLWLFDRRAPVPRRMLRWLVSVPAVLVALANLVWVYRVGESGAKSVWSGVAAAHDVAGGYLPFL